MDTHYQENVVMDIVADVGVVDVWDIGIKLYALIFEKYFNKFKLF